MKTLAELEAEREQILRLIKYPVEVDEETEDLHNKLDVVEAKISIMKEWRVEEMYEKLKKIAKSECDECSDPGEYSCSDGFSDVREFLTKLDG